ncbi:hypothetical protein [uncultured Massilia sp.]|uniref:hypothetical protein n=1 Tax=uncultured Massilia sp. TaxID=169973 RepID=UPI0025EB0DA5|nr:hypothetical protein [uncultured Massilia sp.]
MPVDREQLYQALRNADAAGDTKAAQRLAGYIKSLPENDATEIEQGHNLFDTLAAIPGHIKEAVTGDKRHTAITDALPDWAGMPELNSFSMASAKAGLGTLLANPAETVKIIQSNFPGVQARQDDKGNYLLQSSIDGKEYAIKPGFQVSDLPRALGAIAAFTPAGRATTLGGAALGAAGTQAAIEATQAATGGEFNPGEVAAAGVAGAAVPAVVNAVRAAAAPARQILRRVRGVNPSAAAESAAAVDPLATASAEAADAGAATPGARGPAARAATDAPTGAAGGTAPLAAEDLTQTARKAAEGGFGSSRAKQVLAEQASPDPKVVGAAERLGVDGDLQADHVTTNQAFRELSQAAKSIPGSEGRAAELEGLQRVAQRANDLIEEMGGTHDFSTLADSVKHELTGVHDQLKGHADNFFDEIRAAVPAKAEAPAENVLAMIKARADELDGMKNLSPMEKMIFAKLSPKRIMQTEEVPGNPLMPGAQSATKRTVPVTKQPTYALLDDVRRDLTAARIQRAGPFKDSDSRLISMLEDALKKDQRAVLDQHGMAAKWDLAQKTVASYKAVQDDLGALFGKHLDESFVGKMSTAMKALPAGDPTQLIKLLKSVPESMRQEVVASGLSTAFGKTAANGHVSFGKFATWYEGLLKNKQSHLAVMTHLPPGARKQLSDLYRVSKGISAATRERITTGRLNAIKDDLKPIDNFTGRLYKTARESAVGATVGTTVGWALGPGAGAAVASALSKGAKPEAIKAVDKLLTSPEFIELARKTAHGVRTEQQGAILRFVQSPGWRRFAHVMKMPGSATASQRWVTQALQAERVREEQDQPHP